MFHKKDCITFFVFHKQQTSAQIKQFFINKIRYLLPLNWLFKYKVAQGGTAFITLCLNYGGKAMKKTMMISTTAILLATLVSSGAFANGAKKMPEKKTQVVAEAKTKESKKLDSTKKDSSKKLAKTNSTKKESSKNRNHRSCRMMFDENTIIGQVKSVDAAANKITLTNADGVDTDYSVSGFTRIAIMTTAKSESTEKKAPKSNELSDIKSGSWVMLSTMPGKTETQVASRILVK